MSTIDAFAAELALFRWPPPRGQTIAERPLTRDSIEFSRPSSPAPEEAEPLPSRKVRSKRSLYVPRGLAVDQTVALAIRKGCITNRDVLVHTGLSRGGVDQRIQAAYQAGRLERVGNGMYEASAAEYEAIGIPKSKKGRPFPKTVDVLVAAMQDALEAKRVQAERELEDAKRAIALRERAQRKKAAMEDSIP